MAINHFTPLSYEFDEEPDERRSYNPLSFFTTGSTVYHPGPIIVNKSFQSKMLNKNYTPLSLFTKGSTAPKRKINKSSKSKMDKSRANEKSVTRRNFIHDDLLVSSILSKLPVKSLKRFACVRKSWSILFENSDFMTTYSNHFISRHASDDHYHTFLLTCHDELPRTPASRFNPQFHLLGDNTLKLNLPSPFQHPCHGLSILGSTSVNGIFCIGQEDPPQNKPQYVLWNPATEEFWEIRPSIIQRKPHYPETKFHLNHVFHGFGYDRVRDDYKVIQFVSLDHDGMPSWQSKTYFEIYSLKSNSWRWINMNKKIELSHWFYPLPFTGLEVYVDGTCHWLVGNTSNDNPIELTLLSFDLSDEAFITTPIGEESFTPYTYNRRLTVLNGSIALISNYDDNIVFHISILGELGVTESWIKLYIYGPFPSLEWPPFGLGKTGSIFFEKTDGELAYIDLSTKEIKEVDIDGGNMHYVTVGLYKKSLLPIKGSSK